MKRHKRFSPSLRLHEQLEERRLLSVSPWHNTENPVDVNRDGVLSPFDALAGINELNFGGARQLNDNAVVRNSYAFDVNNDGYLSSIDVLRTINAMNAEGENHTLLKIRVQPEDAEGNAIDTIGVGEGFNLSVYVQDLAGRDVSESGVFAAYLDVMFDTTLASVAGDISYGPDYQNGKTGSVVAEGLDEVGAFDGFNPLGTDELLLFTVPMTGAAAGTVTFDADPADIFPAHESLLFGVLDGQSDGAVLPEDIEYVDATIQIGSNTGPTAVNDAYVVDQDLTLAVNVADGVLSNDTDPNNDMLTASLIDDVTNGTLALESDGSFTYTPTPGFTGTDSFTYVA
ncbi:MAG: cadherin-like domain-containing protein, partial [Planctomycetales bacterium]|nr:cadherin-like domain-containing protein [Planctomycetales bacterium]